LKKRSKKLLNFMRGARKSATAKQKFFGSFFQKRTFFLTMRPYHSHRCEYEPPEGLDEGDHQFHPCLRLVRGAYCGAATFFQMCRIGWEKSMTFLCWTTNTTPL
jgi:hypothetical protein